jgi:dihydrofolate reductase
MAKLIYAAIASLDGYVEDEEGRFDWAAPDDQVHAFVNDLERPIGTHLYGRRMYETMVFWETVSTEADQPAVIRDFAGIWRAAEKIVYSRALQTISSARTRIERQFDRDAVRRLKQSSGADITVGGAELAGQALGAGLVDECHLFLCPIVVAGRSLRRRAQRAGLCRVPHKLCLVSEPAEDESQVAPMGSVMPGGHCDSRPGPRIRMTLRICAGETRRE